MAKTNYQDIDEYIDIFPEDVQKILETVRLTTRKAAPEAIEAISYQMPTFKLNGKIWYTSPLGKIISDFTRHPQLPRHSIKNYLPMRSQKARLGFRLINHFLYH